MSFAPKHRVVCGSGVADVNAPEKEGRWRQAVFCLNPHLLEHEEWEDPEEREAKRQRYVQSALHEQSMGRPGPKEYEMQLPVDEGALQCRDADTNAEWDALNPFANLISDCMLAEHVSNAVLPETQQYMLRASERGALSHQEAAGLTAAAAAGSSGVAYEALDPTQASFVDHMVRWRDAVLSSALTRDSNLPLGALPHGAAVLPAVESLSQLADAVLLLGTAGTGKTTTLQAANRLLEIPAFEVQGAAHRKRIVRCAYTGVAASNMGAGGRTIVSLFRLGKKQYSSVLQPLSNEEMAAMAEELGDLALLEIDEVSMLEKSVLAYVSLRLQQWRQELHRRCCFG